VAVLKHGAHVEVRNGTSRPHRRGVQQLLAGRAAGLVRSVYELERTRPPSRVVHAPRERDGAQVGAVDADDDGTACADPGRHDFLAVSPDVASTVPLVGGFGVTPSG